MLQAGFLPSIMHQNVAVMHGRETLDTKSQLVVRGGDHPSLIDAPPTSRESL